jgi:hypothetical protein
VKFFPARESLVSDIPAVDGKTNTFFYSVMARGERPKTKYETQRYTRNKGKERREETGLGIVRPYMKDISQRQETKNRDWENRKRGEKSMNVRTFICKLLASSASKSTRYCIVIVPG